MSATTSSKPKSGAFQKPEPRLLRNSKEIMEFLAAHLKPEGTSPSGAPKYRLEDIEALLKEKNVRLPE